MAGPALGVEPVPARANVGWWPNSQIPGAPRNAGGSVREAARIRVEYLRPWALQTQFCDASLERAGFETEQFGCAALSADPPHGPFEHGPDVFPLHVGQLHAVAAPGQLRTRRLDHEPWARGNNDRS